MSIQPSRPPFKLVISPGVQRVPSVTCYTTRVSQGLAEINHHLGIGVHLLETRINPSSVTEQSRIQAEAPTGTGEFRKAQLMDIFISQR